MNQRALSRPLCRILALVVAYGPGWASAEPVYRITDFGMLDGASDMLGNDLSESGHVTGKAFVNGRERAFLWDGTALIDLGTLGGSESAAHAVNSSGQVTGRAQTDYDAAWRVFLWDGNEMQNLGSFGGEFSDGLDINDAGQTAGASDLPGNDVRHAFIWDAGSLQDLGTLGGDWSRPEAFNETGQVTS